MLTVFSTVLSEVLSDPGVSAPGAAIAPMSLAAIGALAGSLALGFLIFLFIFRIVLTWYPQVDVQKFPFSWVYQPTEPFLKPTRAIVPPIGGVDISPIIWVGLVSLLREVLLGQQGIITMALY